MNLYPKIQFSKLRQIGWTDWDPIGLQDMISDDLLSGPVDEYDSCLAHVVNMLHKGQSTDEAIRYLDWVGSEHMGRGPVTPGAHEASTETVAAILAYLRTLPDGPLNPAN